MSGRAGPGNRQVARVQASLLDRLIDDAPDQERDPAVSAVEFDGGIAQFGAA